MSSLAVNRVTVERGGLPIVREASLTVEAGGIAVLLGVNGAGKTTLLEGISGAVPTSGGEILLDGRRVDRARATRRARLGLGHVEQGRTVFRQLTAEENLRAGLAEGASVEDAFDLFPELEPRRHVAAGLLSGGEQQMLVLARALAARPRVLLLDEMSLGLAPRVVRRLLGAVRELAAAGVAVLLVEQFAALALAAGDRAYVLRRGRVVYDGDCASLRGDERRLHDLYLGEAS